MSDAVIRVLIVSAEVAPFAKAGGLADVAGALPKALKALGVDVRVVMPAYKMVRANPAWKVSRPLCKFPVMERPGVIRSAEVRKTAIPECSGSHGEIPVYLVGETPDTRGSAAYFEHAVDSASIYAMEPDPYIFFDRAVVEWISHTAHKWRPDIVHSNDWHCGLIPLFARQAADANAALRGIAHIFTIHNLAYQGDFFRDRWFLTGLADNLYTVDGLECYGRWSFMKGALNFADYVTTVSPTYAREILTPEYGNGLDGLLHKLDLHGRLHGILNGIDTAVFDPAADPHIAAHYSAEDPSGKATCKAALQKELGLTPDPMVPLIGMVSRLVEQKGLDLFHGEAEMLIKRRVQVAILGLGDPRFEQYLQRLSAQHPTRVAVRIAYDAPLAQRIYAGADLFMMPSRFEPCGLGQLIALRYGALPIVRSTGGLADTITDAAPGRKTGNGFVFSDYTSEALDGAIERAVAAVQDSRRRRMLTQRAMEQDWSWANPAKAYLALYRSALQR